MLRSTKKIMGLPIEALDGKIGKSNDCLFDECHWTLRYLVANTGNWLPGKKVLISPLHLQKPTPTIAWFGESFPVDLSCEQIEGCPELSVDAPVSRQYENEYAQYYHHYAYWNGPYAWGLNYLPAYPPGVIDKEKNANQKFEEHKTRMQKIEENSLHSAQEIMGYHMNAQGEKFGHVDDFLIDDSTWRIHYLIIDSGNWLSGRKILIDIDWIQAFSWKNKEATIDLTKSQIKDSPELTPNSVYEKEYIDSLYDHYGKRREETGELLSK